ncbi:MAG TPA: alpha/beta fold hydrolase, partial [Clostridia bacterium]
DGTVWAWGDNTYGQLGDSTNTNSSTPVQVSGISGVRAISAGYGHTLALKDDGTVWAWGNNICGQLGNGLNTNTNTPVRVTGVPLIKDVVCGDNHSLAIGQDGSLWSWGNNSSGQLMDGQTKERNTPYQVTGFKSVRAVSGSYHTMVLDSDGSVWTCGSNNYCEIGDGTHNPRSTPYKVMQIPLNSPNTIAGSISAPEKLTKVNRTYNPNPFAVTVNVSNTGNVDAKNARAKIVLPEGLKLAAGLEEISLGDLASMGPSKSASWKVEALKSNTDKELSYSVVISTDNQGQKTLSKTIFLPAIPPEVVILIPGVAGTNLMTNCKTGDNHRAWPPTLLNSLDHDFGHLKCDSNGIPIDPGVYPDTLNSDYYGKVYDELKSNKEFDVYTFPYDWRLGCDTLADNLGKFIDSLGEDKVNLVAHSMGGLVSTVYISKGNAGRVKKLITAGTPYLGAPKGLYVFETGNFLEDIGDLAIGSHIKELSPNLKSAYSLLPSSKYQIINNTFFIENKTYDSQHVLLDTTKLRDYSDASDFIKSRPFTNSTLFASNQSFYGSLDIIGILKSVDSYFIVGDGNGSIGKLTYGSIKGTGVTNLEDIDRINGDQTVPLISATIGDQTNYIHPGHTYYIRDTHSQLYNNPSVINQVVNILKGDISVKDGMRSSPVCYNHLKLKVECPVDLHVYDQNGNHMGLVRDGSGYEQNIRGGSIYPIDDKKIAFLDDGNYNIKLTGTDYGTMTYTVQKFDENNNPVKTFIFKNVDITPKTVITSNTDTSGAIVLNVDSDGDGNQDKVILPDGANIKDISTFQHSAALLEDGSVWTWGLNTFGELGDGTTANRNYPAKVASINDVRDVSCGFGFTAALKKDGTVRVWGRNYEGELGNGTAAKSATPVQPIGLTDVSALSCGLCHITALKNDGTVWAWGLDIYGQLGDRTISTSNIPAQINSISNIKAISSGFYHNVALKEDGTVWTWGRNISGQLGDGTTTDRRVPQQVQGLTNVVAVAAGGSHTAVLKADGTVWTWGYNSYGQLGDGTNNDRNLPVQVPGLTGVKALACGRYETIAIKADGTVWTVGNNASGQLGDGTNISKNQFVKVSNLSGVNTVVGGESHVLALNNDNILWSWGTNTCGQLGDGTNSAKFTPVKVLPFR